MVRGAEKSKSFLIFVTLFGAISGSFIGEMLGSNIKSLGFLKSIYFIGTSKPLILDLKVMILTLGLNFNLNFMSIVGVLLAIILYRKL